MLGSEPTLINWFSIGVPLNASMQTKMGQRHFFIHLLNLGFIPLKTTMPIRAQAKAFNPIMAIAR
jgi:hypothetical protein